ncbi:caspase-8 isoform 2-T2 [Anableps anableps]
MNNQPTFSSQTKTRLKMEMNFQKLLLEVGKSLSSDEVEALAFLCTDLLHKNPNSVETVNDLFSLLMKEDQLSSENPELLVELLLIIQRPVIIRDFELTVQQSFSSGLISPYRKLLYHLSEQITSEELKQMKFLLKDVPRRKLEQKSTLGVFLELERMDLINESSLDYLEVIFNSVCPVLNEQIRDFRKDNSRPRSLSLNLHSFQTSKPFIRTSSLRDRDPQLPSSSINSSNFPHDVSQGGNRSEAPTSAQIAIAEVASFDTTYRPEINDSQFQENVEGLDNYPMTGRRRGTCLIVNNYDFSKSPKYFRNREGTNFDQKALKDVFEWLGFDVDVQRDCDAEKIRLLFESLSKQNHSQKDCLVCCILSHGTEGGVFGVDGSLVEIKEMMHYVDGQRCPSLVEKPKLFFIQACQGSKEQPPIQTDGADDETSDVSSDATIASTSIPSTADFLVGMATVPDYVSFRDRYHGTWYIQSLCQNLIKFVPRGFDLVSILTKVNDDVSKKTDGSRMKKQMPQPAFSLRKRVVFPVPTKPAPKVMSDLSKEIS